MLMENRPSYAQIVQSRNGPLMHRATYRTSKCTFGHDQSSEALPIELVVVPSGQPGEKPQIFWTAAFQLHSISTWLALLTFLGTSSERAT